MDVFKQIEYETYRNSQGKIVYQALKGDIVDEYLGQYI